MKWKHHEFDQIVNFQLRKVAMTTSFFPKYLLPCYFKSKTKNKKNWGASRCVWSGAVQSEGIQFPIKNGELRSYELSFQTTCHMIDNMGLVP